MKNHKIKTENVVKIDKIPAIVHWVDAVAHDDKGIKKALTLNPVLRESLGYLIRNDKTAVTLLHLYDSESNGEDNDLIVIPKSLVRKIEYLKFGRNK